MKGEGAYLLSSGLGGFPFSKDKLHAKEGLWPPRAQTKRRQWRGTDRKGRDIKDLQNSSCFVVPMQKAAQLREIYEGVNNHRIIE